jgi:hypothetical protein
LVAPSPRVLALLSLLLGLSTACSGDLEPDNSGARVEMLFTFDSDTEGWIGGFTDLALSQVNDVGFLFGHRQLPADTGLQGGALFISGKNVSDDLFMFLAYPVRGLRPETSYSLAFELKLASNAPAGCVGVGGAPGESVYLKVGAATERPARVTASSGSLRLNLDKGEQSQGGANAQVVGDVTNGMTGCDDSAYRLITRDNRASPFRVTSDSQGELWLLVGTDSGFEATTALYYDTIRVTLEVT